jgi:hypothetical protein
LSGTGAAGAVAGGDDGAEASALLADEFAGWLQPDKAAPASSDKITVSFAMVLMGMAGSG